MRTTVNIDDTLYAQAVDLTDIHKKTALLREGLKALIGRENARRLTLLGGSEPAVEKISRRHSKVTRNK